MSSSTEPTVTTRGIPPDYSFVPKGNVYITANCRKTTQEDGETVYVIVAPGGNDKKTLGIAVPRNIHDDVRAREAETRAQRAAVVDKRDASIQTEFKKAIRQEYPGIPDDSLAKVLQTALQKRSGKVGRTGTLDIQLKARLAVRAHIRHCHTLYDTHLRAGRTNQNEARAAIKDEVDALAAAWGKGPGARSHAKTHRRKAAKTGRKAANKKADAKKSAAAIKTTLTKSTTAKTSARPLQQRTINSIVENKRSEAVAASLDMAKSTAKIQKTAKRKIEHKPPPGLTMPQQRTRRATRSTQSISESIQDLALRLPDDADYVDLLSD